MRMNIEDLLPYTNETALSFVEPWKPTAYEAYETVINAKDSLKITKVYGRPRRMGHFQSMAISIGNWGLISKEGVVQDNHNIPIVMSLPTLDDDTSFTKGYAHHTAVVMAAMLKNHDRLQGATVVEYGAGTGALSLLALRLGAKNVILFERDANLCKHAKILFQHHGIHPLSYRIIQDDLEHAGDHKSLLSEATVGISNLGHWNEYKNIHGHYADMLAYDAIHMSYSMHTLISGGYKSGFVLNPQLPLSWDKRRDTHIRNAGYQLLAHGFETIDCFDSKACLPLMGTTHATVAVRDAI